MRVLGRDLEPGGIWQPSLADAARDIVEIIAHAPCPLDRDEWIGEAAGALGFSVESLREEMRNARSALGSLDNPTSPR